MTLKVAGQQVHKCCHRESLSRSVHVCTQLETPFRTQSLPTLPHYTPPPPPHWRPSVWAYFRLGIVHGVRITLRSLSVMRKTLDNTPVDTMPHAMMRIETVAMVTVYSKWHYARLKGFICSFMRRKARMWLMLDLLGLQWIMWANCKEDANRRSYLVIRFRLSKEEWFSRHHSGCRQ